MTELSREQAIQILAQRRLGYERIEQLRLERLRNMTEREAAEIFDTLDPPRPYRLRPSSGLVEQQRRFAGIRQRLAEIAAENRANEGGGH